MLKNVFFFNDTATTEIYTLSLHDALPISNQNGDYTETAEQMIQDLLPVIQNQEVNILGGCCGTSYEYIRALAKRSEEHTSELQSRQYLVCRLLLDKIQMHVPNSARDP